MEHTSASTRYAYSRYRRTIPYNRKVNSKSNTGSVFATKIIKQSIACILIILALSYLQNTPGDFTGRLLEEIKKQVVNADIQPSEIYQSAVDSYEQCSVYIRSNLK